MIAITVKINGVDKTSLVASLTKTDALFSAPDILKFEIDTYTGQSYLPAANDTVEVFDGATKIFGGVIVQIDQSLDQDNKIVGHVITCRDYGQDLSMQLMVERFESTTINDIISFILTKYAPDFDDAYVDADVAVASITFNNITVSQALDKLAKLSNYQWYADYDHHLHFFIITTEAAPYNISDLNGNYIPDTFTIKEDLTQIKNRVTVIGGLVEVNPVTFTITGDIGKLQDNGNVTFDLSYKFSNKPVVTVNGTPATIGVVGFDNSTDFDAMWSYDQKYLNFTSLAIAPTDDIEISGTPLENIQVRVQDSTSIALYGRWDASFSVPGIKTRDEALQYAEAQRDAAKDPIYSGQFQTYVSGLRSGQTITINSTKLGVNEDFFINQVTFKMLSPSVGVWTVQVSTVRQITLIDILNRIVGNPESNDLATEGLLSYLEFDDTAQMVDGAPSFSNKTGPYQIWPTSGSGTGQPLIINFGTISS